MAHEIIVVVSPEPTSITDAYALMKVLSLKYAEKSCKLLVNRWRAPGSAGRFPAAGSRHRRFLEHPHRFISAACCTTTI